MYCYIALLIIIYSVPFLILGLGFYFMIGREIAHNDGIGGKLFTAGVILAIFLAFVCGAYSYAKNEYPAHEEPSDDRLVLGIGLI